MNRQRPSVSQGGGGEQAPAIGKRLIDGQEPFLEPFVQIFFQPCLQMSAPFPRLKFFNSSSDLAKGQDAGKERVGVSSFKPVLHPLIGLVVWANSEMTLVSSRDPLIALYRVPGLYLASGRQV